MTAVTTLIVNFNTSGYLATLLASIDVESCDDIVIVDNGSTEADEVTSLRALALSDERVRLVRSLTNRGFGGGVNLGLTLVPREEDRFVWVLNPDVVVLGANVLNVLGDECESLGLKCVVSPTILYTAGRGVWFAGGEIDQRRGVTRHLSVVRNGRRFDSFLTGAAMFAHRSVWSLLDGFREDLFLYWEDADFAIRAAKLGISLRTVALAVIEHDVGGSVSSGSERAISKSSTWHFYMQRNRLLVCGDGLRGRLSVAFGFGAPGTLRLVLRALRDPSMRGVKLLASFRGISEGIRGRSGQFASTP